MKNHYIIYKYLMNFYSIWNNKAINKSLSSYLKIFISTAILISFYITQAQNADLIVQKTGPTQCYVGEQIQYTIIIENQGPAAADGATFNDNFPSGVSNVSLSSCNATGGAICPSPANYNISNTNFSGIIPTLPSGGKLTFIITLNAPMPATASSISNTASCNPPAGITDPDMTTNSSTWNTTIITIADIEVLKTVTPTTAGNCNNIPLSFDYTVKWINHGPANAGGIQLRDNIQKANQVNSGSGNTVYTYHWSISNLLWQTSSSNTPVPTQNFVSMSGSLIMNSTSNQILTSLYTILTSFTPGDTITLTFTFTLNNVTTTGCGRNIQWNLQNIGNYSIPSGVLLTDPISGNNSQTVTNSMSCTDVACPVADIEVLKTVTPTTGGSCNDLPLSFDYTVKWINHGPANAGGIQLRDNIQKANHVNSGSGNTVYTYHWSISNLLWQTSSSNTPVPTQNFVPMSGSLIMNSTTNQILTSLTTTLTSFVPGDTITLTFTFTLNNVTTTGCGRNIQWNLQNIGNYSIPSGVLLTDPISGNNSQTVTNSMSCTDVACPEADIEVLKTVSPTTGANCNDLPLSFDYTVKWINHGPANAGGIQLNDQIQKVNHVNSGSGNTVYTYHWSISNLLWQTSSSNTPIPTQNFNPMSGSTTMTSSNNQSFASLYTILTSFTPGDTITLTFTFTLSNVTTTGCGRNIQWNLQNRGSYSIPNGLLLTDPISSNNTASVINSFSNFSTDLSVSKYITPNTVNTGDTIQFSIEFQNASMSPTDPAVWIDTIPNGLDIILSSISCSPLVGISPCGTISYDPATRILTQTIASMPANTGVLVTYKLIVTQIYSVTQESKVYAIHPCIDCIPATNYSNTNFTINGFCDWNWAGLDGTVNICDNSLNVINLFNALQPFGTLVPIAGGNWTRISGIGGVFNAVAGSFTPTVGVTNSVFMYVLPENLPCPADTAYVFVNFFTAPLLNLSSTTGSTCDIIPITVTNNSFGGSATEVTLTHTGFGTISPAISTTTPFNFTYTPASSDIGNTVVITVTTNNPTGLPCTSATGTYSLAVNANPSVTACPSNPFVCIGNTLTLNCLPSGGTYTVLSGSASASGNVLTVNGAGLIDIEYAVTENGCISSSSFNVTGTPYPVISNCPSNTIICVGNTLTLNCSPIGGTYTVLSGPASVSGNILTVNGAGLIDIEYSITENGCTTSSSLNVTGASYPVISNCPTNPFVFVGNTITLNCLPPGGTYTVLSGPATVLGNVLTATGTGTINIEYSITENGCNSTNTFHVTGFTLPVIPNQATFCERDTGIFIVSTIGLSVLNYQWQINCSGTWSNISNGGTNPLYVGATDSLITLYGLPFSLNGCQIRCVIVSAAGSTISDIVTLNINQAPLVSFSGLSASYCINFPNIITLTGTPVGGTFNGNGINAPHFSPSLAGIGTHIISYTYIDSLQCQNSFYDTTTVYALPDVSLTPFNDVCINTPAYQLSGGLPLGGTYSGNSIYGNIFDPSTAGLGNHIITYTYVDINACTNYVSESINVNILPEVFLVSNVENNLYSFGQFAIFTAIPSTYELYDFYINNYLKQSSILNTYTTNVVTEDSAVTVIAFDGECISLPFTLSIDVQPIFNVLTPNGDGKNDVFLKNHDLTIVNRWGQLLYEGFDGWDGTYNNKQVASGTYFYVIRFIDSNENQIINKGSVTLIRE